MAESAEVPGLRKLSTPHAAAAAGVVFSLLFTASLVLLRTAIPQDPVTGTRWLDQHQSQLNVGLALMPLAGIAFLLFVGVVRDRIGTLEDRFFSTVFYGSSLLFLAMVFVATAFAGALVAAAHADRGGVHDAHVVNFGRAVMLQVSNVYALRMGAVLMISLATIWLRTELMPRWLVALTYLLAVGLLVIVRLDLWVALVFPAWVFVVSVQILRNVSSLPPRRRGIGGL